MKKLTLSIVAVCALLASPIANAATPAPIPAPVSPTDVGAYFKVEQGYMINWTLPKVTTGVTGYTVTSSNGAKCVVSGATSNKCIYSSSTVPNPFRPFIPYTFTVVSNSKSGDSSPSAPSNAATWNSAPGYPAPLLSKVISDTQIDIDWVPSTSTGNLPIYGYRVTYWEAQLNAYGDPKNETRIDVMSTNTFTSLKGLKPSTWYVIGVAECNALGCSMSDWNYVMTTPKTGPAALWHPPLTINGGNASTTCWDAVLNGGTAASTGTFTKAATKCSGVTIDPATYPKIDPTATDEKYPNLVNKFDQGAYWGLAKSYSMAVYAKWGLSLQGNLGATSKSVMRGFTVSPVVTSTTPTVCTISNGTINLLKIGKCSVSASFPASNVWAASGILNATFDIVA